MFETKLERLNRLAQADGLQVVKAGSKEQEHRWGGKFAIYRNHRFLYASSQVDQVRGWLHANGRPVIMEWV